MPEFLGWGSNYNPWEIDDFIYRGKLYHYTNKDGCDGIFNPKASNGNPITLPEGCIALRLTKIVHSDKNDKYERRHVQEIVDMVTNDLLREAEITESFADIVRKFRPTDVGYNSVITDEPIEGLENQHIRWGYDKLDYYIACFSINPDNKYIMENFRYPIRLAFSSALSNPDEVQYRHSYKDGLTAEWSYNYNNLHPYSLFSQCFLSDHTPGKFREVLYDKQKKFARIKKCLLDIRENSSDEEHIKEQVEEMYSLYDAIFKSSEGDYYKEEEVRFVIAVRSTEQHDSLEQHGFVFDHDPKDGKDYLYVPISKQFLIGGDADA